MQIQQAMDMIDATRSGLQALPPPPEAQESVLTNSADNAAKIEARYFVELATGKVAKNMTKAFFFDLQKIMGGGSRPKDVAPSSPTWTFP